VTDDRRRKRRMRTATERDLEGLAARRERERAATPVSDAVPLPIPADQAFTPVAHVLERIPDVPTRNLAVTLWQHTANMELRCRQRVGDKHNVAKHDVRIRELEDWRIDERGEMGTNGKLGALGTRVHEMRKGAVWLMTTILAGAVAGIVKLILVGRSYGALENQVDTNTSEIERLERRLEERSRRHEPPPDAAEKAVSP
jgi:hypothetical protein